MPDTLAARNALPALVRAIDDGDDSLLPVWADALEDVGDLRAAGLRLVGGRRPLPLKDQYAWTEAAPYWWPDDRPGYAIGSLLEALPDGMRCGVHRSRSVAAVSYGTRSAAYLALASALLPPLADLAAGRVQAVRGGEVGEALEALVGG